MKLETCLKLDTEKLLKTLTLKFPGVTDGDNYLLHVPENHLPLCLVAHLDVSGKVPVKNLVHTSFGVVRSDGTTILGADDRAGVFAIFEVMRRLEGQRQPCVLFTNYEECGGLGIAKAIRDKILDPISGKIHLWVELDRQGTGEAVTYRGDLAKPCRDYLKQWGWQLGHGSYTDICDIIEETGTSGVNLSVGYTGQHSTSEYLCLDSLNLTINRVVSMCHNPPTERFEHEPEVYYSKDRSWGKDWDEKWMDEINGYKSVSEMMSTDTVAELKEFQDASTDAGFCPDCTEYWVDCTCGRMLGDIMTWFDEDVLLEVLDGAGGAVLTEKDPLFLQIEKELYYVNVCPRCGADMYGDTCDMCDDEEEVEDESIN